MGRGDLFNGLQGHRYSCGTSNIGMPYSTELDVIDIRPTESLTIIHWMNIGQATTGFDSDDDAEMLRYEIYRATTLGATSLQNPAIAKFDDNSPGSQTDVRFGSDLATGLTLLESGTFLLQHGWRHEPAPPRALIAPAEDGEALVVRVSAPAFEVRLSCTVMWEEIKIT